MNSRKLTLVALWLLMLTGCSSERLRQGMYEGFRVRNDLQTTPAEKVGRPESPDYGEYERLRTQQR
ncbi:hypothetical protein [Geobacter sp. DSM 9736]|uniref:hypothetical protein n=1 Tax=Geobacter sp. DSM 9736 TaxID=1277350 RepID=UPI000B60FF9D|nr:hypothetical protein [Geobacter sp. DSM 9736]SNB45250.1 hypothetical protein SAMN06269301_0654 [Geobacter sp. DSM 9736]